MHLFINQQASCHLFHYIEPAIAHFVSCSHQMKLDPAIRFAVTGLHLCLAESRESE
jgi:hypothetical protein